MFDPTKAWNSMHEKNHKVQSLLVSRKHLVKEEWTEVGHQMGQYKMGTRFSLVQDCIHLKEVITSLCYYRGHLK